MDSPAGVCARPRVALGAVRGKVMTDDPARSGSTNDRQAANEQDAESGPRHVGVAEAKATFSALIEGVQHRSERYVIERHGKPAAALVSVEELERLGSDQPPERRNDGLSGFIGLFAGLLTDEEIDEMVETIYAGRERDRDSPARVDFSDLLD